MTNRVDKSLEEVWEMKAAAQKAFDESGYTNYSDYLEIVTKGIRDKYNIKYHSESNIKKPTAV